MDAIKKTFIGVTIGAILLLPCFVSAGDYGLEETARRTKLFGMNISKSNPESLAAQIVTIGLGFIGTIFFVLVLFGGITWMTAMGSTEKINQAKSILQMAFIGLIIVAASYAIATFIFSQLAAAPQGEGGCKGRCVPPESPCPAEAAEGICSGDQSGYNCCNL